jgi:putative endonuclease
MIRPQAEESLAAERGRLGEDEAARLLRAEGMKLVVRNWRNGREEIDLVCLDGEALVFVEVKTRAEGSLVPGYYAIRERQRKALRRAARAYLRGLRERPRTIRFDVVEVVRRANGSMEAIRYENAPLFTKEFNRGARGS